MKCPTCGAELPRYSLLCKRCQKEPTKAIKAITPETIDSLAETQKKASIYQTYKLKKIGQNQEPGLAKRTRVNHLNLNIPEAQDAKKKISGSETPVVSYLVCPPFQPMKLEKDKKFTIGRDEANQLVLPSREVSRAHSLISWGDNGYIIEDLSSANGTFVNDDYIEFHPLANRDKIFIGTHIIIYREVLMGTMPGTDTSQTSLQDTLKISFSGEDTEQRLQEASGSSFNGDLESISLVTILQMLGAENKSGGLKLLVGEATAYVYFLEGIIVHSEYKGTNGRDAFYQLMRLTKGKFEFNPFNAAREVTMSDNVEFLLLEVARMMDEESKDGDLE